jgi:hypothetical protein
MNDDLPIKSPVPPTPAGNPDDESVAASDRVFDISGDTIKPITEDELIAPPAVPIADKPSAGARPPANPILSDANLLDKKIGSFDTTPFAPAQNKAQNFASAPATAPITAPAPTSTPIPIPASPASGLGSMPIKPAQPTFTPKPAPSAPTVTKTTIPIQKIPPTNTPGWSPYRPTPPVVPKTSPTQTWQGNISAPRSPESYKPLTNTNQPKTLQEVATAALPSYLQNLKPKAPPETPVQEPTTRPTPTQTQNPDAQPKISSDPRLQQNLKPIRTYEGDIAEMMSRKRTSMANVAIAESKKQEGSERISNAPTQARESSHSLKKLLLVLVSLVLLFGGAFAAYYLYSISPIAPVEPVTQGQKPPTSIIPSDSQQVLTLDSESPIRILSQIRNAVASSQAPGTVKEIVVASKRGESLVRTSSSRMIDLMEIDAPSILTRSLTNDWMLGVYNNMQNEKDVFVVLTTSFFQNTFAGMLQWERVMADDIKGYIYPDSLEGISNTPITPPVLPDVNPLSGIDSILPSTEQATTTATGTEVMNNEVVQSQPPTTSLTSTTSIEQEVEPLRPYFTLRGTFEDRIIKNKDVRAFRTTDGEIIFLYSFIDNKSLVITGKEETLTEIITRLEKQSFIR